MHLAVRARCHGTVWGCKGMHLALQRLEPRAKHLNILLVQGPHLAQLDAALDGTHRALEIIRDLTALRLERRQLCRVPLSHLQRGAVWVQ